MHADMLLVTKSDRASILHLAAHSKRCLPLLKLFGGNVCSTFGASPDATGDTPLHIVCNYCDDCLDACLFLVKRMGNKFDVNLTNDAGWTMLHIACSRGRAETVEWLIRDMQANPMMQIVDGGATPMHLACEGGFLEIVNCMLERASELADMADHEGTTPRDTAAEYEHWAIVKLLDHHQRSLRLFGTKK
jgi:ankyrin repeat protein